MYVHKSVSHVKTEHFPHLYEVYSGEGAAAYIF